MGGATYVHKSAIGFLDGIAKENVDTAQALLPTDFCWSVVKIAGKELKTISFLNYQDFASFAFPELKESCLIKLADCSCKRLQYSKTNPPILHRKELLLAPDDPARSQFAAITEYLESLGLFKEMARMGTRVLWGKALKDAGIEIDGATVSKVRANPLHSDPSGSKNSAEPRTLKVDRHKTAITRSALSAPMYLLFSNGLINSDTSVLDFGCGQGDDVKTLLAAGYDIVGWDPHYRPNPSSLRMSQILNLGFVLNVIEDPVERAEALKHSFSLTERCLAVSVMLYGKVDLSSARPFGDGYMTSRNTFQKYFTQSELREFIFDVLNVEPIAAGPGIFFVFRDELEEQRYLLRRQIGLKGWETKAIPKSVFAPKSSPTAALTKEGRTLVDNLAQEVRALGRQPDVSELPKSVISKLKKSGLGLQHATHLAISEIGHAELDNIVANRSEELSLYFAMHAFSLRKSYGSFPPELKRDIRAFFGSHARAHQAGQTLLYSIGNQDLLLDDASKATASGIGYLEDGKFQFHISDLPNISVRLRGYVALAERLTGDLSEMTLLRLHLKSRKLTALLYQDFDTSFLPRLDTRLKAEFQNFDVTLVDHSADTEVRLLYLKSRYMPKIDQKIAAQTAFDQEILDLNNFDFSNEGPNFREFARTLLSAGIKIPK